MTRFLLIVSLLFTGCEKTMPNTPAPSTHAIRYLALGDSYTIGESVDPSERWPMQLAAKLREQKIGIGDPQIIARTGWTTDELNAAIDDEKPTGPFGLVTLLIGVNNQYRGRSVVDFRPQFVGLLNRAIGFAANDKSRVIVISIPDWGVTPFADGRDRSKIGAEIDAFNKVCAEESALAGVGFVDINPVSKQAAKDSSLVAPDGLHPSGKMYAEWVKQAVPTASGIFHQK